MQWIQATNKLPEIGSEVCVKANGSKYVARIYDETVEDNDGRISFFFNNRHHFRGEYSSIQWLDESVSLPIPSSIVRRLEEIDPQKSEGTDTKWYEYYSSQVEGAGKDSFIPSAACYIACKMAEQELFKKIKELLSAQPDAAILEYYPTGGIDKDVVGDFFYANKVENATAEVQEFKNSDTRLSLMLVDNRVKAYVIETRTAFNNVMFIKGIVGNSVSAAQPAEQVEVVDRLLDKITPRHQQQINYAMELEIKNDVLVKALERITEPIKFMRSDLKEGEQLNGQYAIQLSNDPEYLKSIARKALSESTTPQPDNKEEKK